MQGKVKWFSTEKGFGFIYGDDDIERYMSVRDIKGADLPKNGDWVEFDHVDAKKGPQATNIRIVTRSSAYRNPRQEDRVQCSHCGHKMVPQMITYNGKPKTSVCPFCGEIYKRFGMPEWVSWLGIAVTLALAAIIYFST